MNVLREVCEGNQENMTSLAKIRGYLGAMFMSDIVTADGKFLKQHVTDVDCLPLKRSHYNFPREEPTQGDWEK